MCDMHSSKTRLKRGNLKQHFAFNIINIKRRIIRSFRFAALCCGLVRICNSGFFPIYKHFVYVGKGAFARLLYTALVCRAHKLRRKPKHAPAFTIFFFFWNKISVVNFKR